MNNNVVVGVIGLSIFGAGFGAGYLFLKKRLEKKYADIAQNEIDSVIERFKCEKSSEKIVIPNDPEEEDEEATEGDEEEEEQKQHDPSKDYTDDPFAGMSREEIEDARDHHKRVLIDYSSMYKPSPDEVAAQRGIMYKPGGAPWNGESEVEADNPEEHDDDFEDAETDEEREIREGEALGRVNHEYPYIIEPEQYDTECEHYDKIDLFYYAKDDTLIDEDDVPVDSEDFDDALSTLSMQTNAYMRNEKVGADYAIHRLNRSYKEDVLGIAETPNEREYRHLARRKSVMDGED